MSNAPKSSSRKRQVDCSPARWILFGWLGYFLVMGAVFNPEVALASGEENPSNKALSIEALKKAFDKVAKSSKSGILMDRFVDQLEDEIKPHKLDEWTGGVDLGVGEFRVGSQTNATLRLQLTARETKDSQGNPVLVLMSAKIQIRRKPDARKLRYETIGSEWKEGEYKLENLNFPVPSNALIDAPPRV